MGFPAPKKLWKKLKAKASKKKKRSSPSETENAKQDEKRVAKADEVNGATKPLASSVSPLTDAAETIVEQNKNTGVLSKLKKAMPKATDGVSAADDTAQPTNTNASHAEQNSVEKEGTDSSKPPTDDDASPSNGKQTEKAEAAKEKEEPPRVSARTEFRNRAVEESKAAMKELQRYQDVPLTKQDKVLVMQGWNKALAFTTAFSEALLTYWRILCCESGKKDPMKLVETNKDPVYLCLRNRITDAETLIMGLLDGAIRSLCPKHQHVQREAYRPMQSDAILERASGEFTLECVTIDDHLALFARLGVKPEYWVKFAIAVHWAVKTHTPYSQEDDFENLELGASRSAFGRVVALHVSIPAIQTYKALATLYQAPIVHQIQDIWGRFSETGRADFGEVFYRKLLNEHPQLLDFFSKTDMDALALHLSMALDMVVTHVHAMGVINTLFRTSLDSLAEVHRRMNVPTYSYALVGATILECFQPVFDQEEANTKDSDDPVSAADLRAALSKVYTEIMSLVYYPMLKQEKMIATAHEFYQQIKEELNWSDSQFATRMMQIEEEIQKTGTYVQTTDELETGARLAWRNSAKCVGRIAWNTLKIRDCRHIHKPEKIFEELRQHLLEATAGTNIQSVMTVFEPQQPDEVFGTRFWSSQLVRYAAYKNPLTGEIVGDPANLELTEYLVSNKFWEPPDEISRFDVLPLVLKVPGRKKPYVKQLPSDCIFEVNLEHPDNPELSKLGLRWTTVPAISNFKMNLGGIVYQNMPFNGWFLSTEIVRNLMERYDVGPEMAKVCGLDKDNDPMWRQTVSCELERMVLHSFQKHKFTIVDPMTVGRSFCTHVQREREQHGRECPAQWSWIGGLLGPTNPTWHLENRDFLIKPQYEYCAEGLLLHEIAKSEQESDLMSVVTDSTDAMSLDLEEDIPELPKVLILYGSQTGNAEAAARRMKRELRQLKPIVMALNDAKGLKVVDKSKITHVLAICSTFGDGHAPANALEFFETELLPFSNSKKYAVLGLGSTIYPKFCQAAQDLSTMLANSGMDCLATLTKADEAAGSDGTIDSWIKMMKALIIPPNIQEVLNRMLPADSVQCRIPNKLIWLSDQEAEGASHPTPAGESLCVGNDVLVGEKASRVVRKITFECPSAYETGDHLSVLPVNSDEMVKRFLRCFKSEIELTSSIETTTADDMIEQVGSKWFDLQSIENGQPEKAEVFFETPTTLGYLLKNCLNLSLSSKDAIDVITLTKDLVEERLQSASEADRAIVLGMPELQSLLATASEILEADSKSKTGIVDDFIAGNPTIVDFLERNLECLLQPIFDDKPILELAEVLCIMTRLQPRYYSISSCNKVNSEQVSISVGVLQVQTSKGVTINGVCSNYLASLSAGEDKAIIGVHKSSFRLPEDQKAPIMMVGAGTGLAPMMGFLDEKALAKKDGEACGSVHLFFGCRTMDDFIYKDKLLSLEEEGLIQFHHALSRPIETKMYVQDKIKETGKAASDLLLRDDTHYYVCGDARMANSCYEACIDVLRKHATMSRVSAARHLKIMEAQGRWQTDVWGIVSNYEDAKKKVMNSKRQAAKFWMQSLDG